MSEPVSLPTQIQGMRIRPDDPILIHCAACGAVLRELTAELERLRAEVAALKKEHARP